MIEIKKIQDEKRKIVMLRERQEIVREKEIEDTRWREKELDSGADRTKEVKC